MPIERWNGTRYETVDLALIGPSSTPLGGLVWDGSAWRRAMLRPPQPNAVAYSSTGPHAVTRSVETTYRTITVTAGPSNANGPMRLNVSWAWPSSSSLSTIREIRVKVNGVLAEVWSQTGTSPWTAAGSVDLGLAVGDVVTVAAFVDSSTTAARSLNLTTELTRLPYVNPRPEARLWHPFSSSSFAGVGIERPTVTTVSGSPAYRLGTTRLNLARIRIPSASTAPVTDGFSYSFWFRTVATTTGWKTLLWQHPTGNTTPESYIVYNQISTGAGAIVTGLRMGSKVAEFASSQTYATGTWWHVVVTWDRPTTTSWRRRLYVNGVQTAADTGTGYPTTPQVVGYPIELGSPEWYGDMDDFGYWDRPLTHAEVLALYNMKDPSDFAGV